MARSLSRVRPDDRPQNASTVIERWGGLFEIQQGGGKSPTAAEPREVLAIPVITFLIIIIGVIVPETIYSVRLE